LLSTLIGQSPIEVGKTAVLLFVTLIAAVALQQLATTRGSQTAGQADRSAVLNVSRQFGQALTTYDYAHPDVQLNHLSPIASTQVLNRVRGAVTDLRLYRAVSVGDAPDGFIQSLDSERAEVLLQTRSVVQSVHTPPGTHASGLLVCDLGHTPGGWMVQDYRWLTPVTEGVS
jgi:hypothetical protein